jgi:peptidyl-prolyl cis-trans isomerase D
LVQEADRVGIEVSDYEMALLRMSQPAFQTSDGKYSEELYQRALKRMGMKRSEFDKITRQDLALGRLLSLASASVHVPEAQVRRQYELDSARVDLTWVRIPDEDLLDDVDVQPDAVQAFAALNAERIKQAYDADRERLYHQPRKADLSVILVRTDIGGEEAAAAVRPQAERVLQEAQAGADFAELARTWSEDLSAGSGGEMGLLAEDQLDPAVAEAVFAAGPGQLTGLVETARGIQVLRVNQVVDAVDLPLADVQESIARDLIARDGVGAVASAYADRLLAAWKAAGAPPADVMAEQGLESRSTGLFPPSASSVPGLGAEAAVVVAVGAATAPGVLDQVFPVAGGRVVAAVSALTPADPSGYDETKEGVRLRLLARERREFVELWRRDLVARARVEQVDMR